MTRPSMSQVKSEGQPRWVVDRVNDEHLFGRLYMRKISPRATWILARLGWSPNAVTVAFIACGVAAGVVVAFGGLVTAIVAAVLVQLALLFDCSDGELARLTKRTSAGGIYLFQDAAAAARYREKHERRLSAVGLAGVTANAFSVNTELSVLTMARAALGDAGASKNPSTVDAIPS